MNERAFSDVMRTAVALTRRALLAPMMLGGAGLAVVAGPSSARAGKKARKRCKKEKQQCRSMVEAFCEGEEPCQSEGLSCCATCNVKTAVLCVLDAFD